MKLQKYALLLAIPTLSLAKVPPIVTKDVLCSTALVLAGRPEYQSRMILGPQAASLAQDILEQKLDAFGAHSTTKGKPVLASSQRGYERVRTRLVARLQQVHEFFDHLSYGETGRAGFALKVDGGDALQTWKELEEGLGLLQRVENAANPNRWFNGKPTEMKKISGKIFFAGLVWTPLLVWANFVGGLPSSYPISAGSMLLIGGLWHEKFIRDGRRNLSKISQRVEEIRELLSTEGEDGWVYWSADGLTSASTFAERGFEPGLVIASELPRDTGIIPGTAQNEAYGARTTSERVALHALDSGSSLLVKSLSWAARCLRGESSSRPWKTAFDVFVERKTNARGESVSTLTLWQRISSEDDALEIR